jgi:hypothetical protein
MRRRGMFLVLLAAAGMACGGGTEGAADGDAADDARTDADAAADADTDADADAEADGTVVDERYDVIVAGAGSGGIAAAIQARRLGATVLLLEETDWVGGQMGAAAVTSMDGGGGPTGTGMYGEWRARVEAYYGDTTRFPPAGKSIHTCYGGPSVCFEPRVGRELLETWLEEEGVVLRDRTRVVRVLREGDLVVGVETSDGLLVGSTVLIDATELGDVIPLTGARYRVGNSTSDAVNLDACIQDLTYLAVMRRYPDAVPAALVISAPPPGYTPELRADFATLLTRDGIPEGYPLGLAWHSTYRGMPDSTNPLSYDNTMGDQITRTGMNFANDYPGYRADWVLNDGACAADARCCEAGVCDGAVAGLRRDVCCHVLGTWRDTLRVRYLEDRAERRRIDCAAKLLTLQFLHYFQTEIDSRWSVADDEGYDSPYNLEDNACPDMPAALQPLERLLTVVPYVRESRRIVALHTLTAAEIYRDTANPLARTRFITSLAVGDYGTDLHNCHADDQLEGYLGETGADGSGGGYFQVPFETLVPERIDGFLPAEKNIGVTRLVNGATRLQPITMLTGAAAGTIAALAVRDGVQPRAVDPLDVQVALVDGGAAVAVQPFDDVPVGHAHFGDVQIAAVRGAMGGVSDSHFAVEDDATRAQAAVVLAPLFGLSTDSPPDTATFGDDVPVGHWAFAYVEALAAEGITSGCGPRSYCPDVGITRAQLAVFLGLGLHLPAGGPTFGDVTPAIAPFAAQAVAAGLMDPCSTGSFCPDQVATRGLLAQIARRILVRAAD